MYGPKVNDPTVGGVKLNLLGIMNSTDLITLEKIRLECFNLGLKIKSPGDSVGRPSLFNPEVSLEDKLDVQLLNRPCSAEELNYTENFLADCRHC